MRKIDTLKKNYEFKNVLDKGKFYRGKYITFYITKNKKEKNIIEMQDCKCNEVQEDMKKLFQRAGILK